MLWELVLAELRQGYVQRGVGDCHHSRIRCVHVHSSVMLLMLPGDTSKLDGTGGDTRSRRASAGCSAATRTPVRVTHARSRIRRMLWSACAWLCFIRLPFRGLGTGC